MYCAIPAEAGKVAKLAQDIFSAV